MKNILFARALPVLMLSLISLPGLWGQQPTQPFDPGCYNATTLDTMVRSAFITYGSGVRMKSSTRRMKLTVGQSVVGPALGDDNNMNFGFWAGYLVAPFPPFVTATQGDLLDRIQITWGPNPLGPYAVGGFKIYRDGIYLAQVDKNTRNFNDFNVIAGRPYLYEVRGINAYGEGSPGKALGFQVPNGVVTGWVRTLNDNPVPNAMVTLMPMQGYSGYFGPYDGALAKPDTSTAENFLPVTDSPWTIAFWIKTESSNGLATIMNIDPLGLAFQVNGNTTLSAQAGGAALTGSFNASANNWHHVALSYQSGMYRLYLDGVLSSIGSGTAIVQSEELQIGAKAGNQLWTGRMDELRIYHIRLDELDLPEVMEGTASSLTEGLKYYWKFDEEKGSKTFDVLHRNRLFFCGAIFSNDRPPVRTAGKTNEEGYYRIESANYGTGITFLAEPSKLFYAHRAVKFDRPEMNYATLPDFSLKSKSTLELWVNSAGPEGTQTLLSKRWNGSNSFQLQLVQNGLNNQIQFKLNNQVQDFGPLGIGYHHLAFTIDSTGSGTQVYAYKDGQLLGTVTMPAYTGTWLEPGEPWVMGARKSGVDFVDYYGGLIDEFAVYDTTLSQPSVQGHFQQSRDPQEKGLRIYYAMDEGTGNQLYNTGSQLFTSPGMTFGAKWTIMSPNQTTTPHEFAPATRQVTLNPSITSVDQVDFTDRSTIPVYGFVRYQNTDCFAKNVEILVNGESFFPPVYTDTTGKFVIDLEPGATVVLTPKYENHEFLPANWQILNITSPVAGLVFNDVTTRKIKGVVAGGDCKLPIISNPGAPSGTVCIVKVRSLDGCFERIQQIDNEEGDYEFLHLPPIAMTVAVVEHSDPTIKTAFQVLGGSQVDLRTTDTIVNFIYYAPPQVEIVSGLDPYSLSCPTIVLEQGKLYTMELAMKEYYLGQGCPLDTGSYRIINDVAGSVVDTTFSGLTLKIKFRAGIVNSSEPFLQNIQIVGKSVSGNESSTTKQVLVTGLFAKSNTFTTQLPSTPSLVLRDPPGDGSYAFLEKEQQVCQKVTFSTDNSVTAGGTVVLDFGPDLEIELFGIDLPLETNIGPEITNSTTITKISDNTMEVCNSFSERIATSSEDLIVGPADSIPYLDGWVQGGDIFVGGGLNVDFGFADDVTFDTMSCMGAVKSVVSVSPKNYKTTYMYTDYHIRNNIIRYLNAIIDDPNTEAGKRDTCKQSRDQWFKILKDNQLQKDAAKFIKNVSFDAGIEYEYSETSDTSASGSSTEQTTRAFEFDFNILVFVGGIGGGGIIHVATEDISSKTKEGAVSKGVTTGYALADNDPGDAFSVNVSMDSVYKTPVFKTVSGQSSCPWEPHTAHREGNSLEFRDGSSAIAVDVPANEPAVFKFTMGNQSETNETWTYAFSAGPESNPDGAKIFLNGAPLDHPVMYAIPYGEVIPVTVTLERGPEAYDYDSLEIVLYSLCEDERANALGILPDLDTILYSAQYISAHFIRPCSEVDINVPQQDWVIFPDPVTQGSDDVMRITVSGYSKNVDEFEKVRVQYRRSDGDGAWINIVPPNDPTILAVQHGAEINKADLGNIFTQFFWDTDGLADGPYEIRAVAICTGDAADKPGYSQIIKGKIERQPPSLIGTPEPADGVYNNGDEISFSFNKPVNCSKINALDNVLLFDATTNQPIDIDITCYENKIILNPNFQNKYFENRILRAELHDIEDKIGNSLDYEQWEFYVDRNELAWLTDSIGMTKFEEESKTVTANIHNRGGYPVPFSITGTPDWVHVVPNQGTLAPNEIRPIQFTVNNALAFGWWKDSITLHTETGQNPFFMGGDESLPLGVRVVCHPPDWPIDGALYENTENMVLQLDIEGQLSTDVEDQVAAFIGDTLVGKANIQFVPQVGKYLAYLTIYGNPNHVLQPLRLEIWDASECLRYAVAEDDFLFQPDDVIGDPLNPQVIHTYNLVLREVPLGFGWNWVSFNLGLVNPDINAALVSLKHPENDLMKSQNQFSTYFNGGGWIGSLQNLGNTSMYVYRANLEDTLHMQGTSLNPAATPINVVPGWNWIAYVPNYSLPVNEALSSVSAQTGDLIKSQVSFAQYINPAFGWIGNLSYMSPPNGYQLKLSAPGTLIYPPQNHVVQNVSNRGPKEQTPPALWTVDPTQFEYSMTLIGMLKMDGANATSATMELGAFAGAQVRGSAQAIYVAPLQSYLFFLTVYANSSGEQLHFKLFDSSTGEEKALNELMYFSPDLHQGSIDNPVAFTLPTSSTTEATVTQSFEVEPNPFESETTLRFALGKAQEVRISVSDPSGRKVADWKMQAGEGMNALRWKARNDQGAPLASGVYFIRLQTENGNVLRKVVLR